MAVCLSFLQTVFHDECKFKESLLPNNYNAYESLVYRGSYIALSKHGRVKKGNKATTAMTVTHFLPRIWRVKRAITNLFAHVEYFPGNTNTYICTNTEDGEDCKRQKHTCNWRYLFKLYMYIWVADFVLEILENAILCCFDEFLYFVVWRRIRKYD